VLCPTLDKFTKSIGAMARAKGQTPEQAGGPASSAKANALGAARMNNNSMILQSIPVQ
jgi:hypothetical protein